MDTREDVLARLRSETFDVVVIGGGIVGAAAARDAVLRGLSVALLDRRDFGSGTSSRTSKLVHGGLRYLRGGHVLLVREALHERDRLYRQETRLVQPIRFYLPVYRGRGVGPLPTRFGLWLYGRLGLDDDLRISAWVPPRHMAHAEPEMAAEGLQGAGTFYDCVANDARLVLEVVKSSVRAGVAAANYVEVIGFGKQDGKIVAVECRDVLRDEPLAVRGLTFLNAAGPWVDRVRALDDRKALRLLRPTRGVHLFVPRDRVGNEHAIALASPRDGRVVFVLPWGPHSLIGTTDTDDPGDPDEVRATAADIDYLLEAVNAHFPGANLTREDVKATYAGLRPLARDEAARESDISRAHEVVRHTSRLYSVVGGKLTTHRAMAEDVLDKMGLELASLGRPVGPCRTAQTPLRKDPRTVDVFRGVLRELGLDVDVASHLAETYVSEEILPLLREHAALRERLVPGLPYLRGEVVHAARAEFARTVEDVLTRRTAVMFQAPRHGEECLDTVVELMAAELDWSEEERFRHVEAYAATVARMFAFRGDRGA